MKKDIILVGGDNLQLYEETCKDMDILFRVTDDLRATLEATQKQPPSLIMVDNEVLGNKSLEICQTLKKYPGTSRYPLLFIVQRSETQILLEALFIPVNDYIFHPIDPEDLKIRIQCQAEFTTFRDNKKLLSVEGKIDELENLLKIFPDYHAALQELADLYKNIGRVEDSLQSYLKLARGYYDQHNFGLAMDIMTRMKNMIAKQSTNFREDPKFSEALDRCIQLIGKKEKIKKKVET